MLDAFFKRKINENEVDGNVKCSCREELFRTERGLQQNCWITNCQTNLNTQPVERKPLDKLENFIETSKYEWGKYANR